MLNKTKKGFTIIESIVAIFFLTIGIIGISTLISSFFNPLSFTSNRLVAAYLAQEGIEIIRNIRDTNLLEEENWDNGLISGNWEVDYTEIQQLKYCSHPCESHNLSYLKIDDNGFYSYREGTQSKFKRLINLQKSGDILEVKVTVFWQEKGRSYQLTAQENFYNWR